MDFSFRSDCWRMQSDRKSFIYVLSNCLVQGINGRNKTLTNDHIDIYREGCEFLNGHSVQDNAWWLVRIELVFLSI